MIIHCSYYRLLYSIINMEVYSHYVQVHVVLNMYTKSVKSRYTHVASLTCTCTCVCILLWQANTCTCRLSW